MPEVPAVLAAEQPILDVYQAAWDRIEAQQQTLINDPLQATQRRRLLEMQRSIDDVMAQVRGATATWVQEQVPAVYATGGVTGAAPMGAGEFIWTLISQEAVEELAGSMFQDVLAATRHIGDTSKALIRAIGQSEALQKAIEGRTAVQAGREMSRLIGDRGISAITYRNGARHGLAEYGQMLARTTTAKAYNYGILNGAAQKGCVYWECFDGPNCGWSAHDSGEQALGKIVTRDEALAFPISHPNCRRAFGPRPDITSPEQAKAAQGGQVTPEQVAAQRAQDAERAARQERRALRNRQTAARRESRSARSTVEKRAARLAARRGS